MEMGFTPVHRLESVDAFDAVDAFAHYDQALLASLRTPADEDAIVAAVEAQLTAEAIQGPQLAPVVELSLRTTAAPRRREGELRAA